MERFADLDVIQVLLVIYMLTILWSIDNAGLE